MGNCFNAGANVPRTQWRFVYDPNTGNRVELGKGATATVYEVEHRSTGQRAAVKEMIKADLDEEDILGVQCEVAAMRKLGQHAHIVALMDYAETEEAFYVVMELVKGGELFRQIARKKKYTERDTQKAFSQLAAAVAHCHERGVAHRDLKPENVLLVRDTADADIKLADFGYAHQFTPGESNLSTPCGTPFYVAPEILRNQRYGPKVDVWSLGVILYIMLCGCPPFYPIFEGKEKASDRRSAQKAEKRMFKAIKRAQFEFYDEDWSHISADAKDLIRKMLTVDTNQRLSAEDILRHRWLQHEAAATELVGASKNIKRFNAKRKLLAVTRVVRSTIALRRMISMAKKERAGDTPSAEGGDATPAAAAAAAAAGGGGSAEAEEEEAGAATPSAAETGPAEPASASGASGGGEQECKDEGDDE